MLQSRWAAESSFQRSAISFQQGGGAADVTPFRRFRVFGAVSYQRSAFSFASRLTADR
jgi:hypothetical protein